MTGLKKSLEVGQFATYKLNKYTPALPVHTFRIELITNSVLQDIIN
jgi:hypothetical protein